MRTVGSVELLDPGTRHAGAIRATGVDRLGASWLFDGERVVVAGGLLPGAGGLAAEVLAVSLEGGAAETVASLCVPRYLHGEVPRGGGRWLLIGGLARGRRQLSATAAVERLDVREGGVERLPDLPFATIEPLVAGLGDGRVLVAGGYDAGVHGMAAVLDTDCGKWEPAPGLPSPRAACVGPFALDVGHLLFAGGCSDLDGTLSRDGLVLDTATLEWERAEIDVPAGAAVVRTGGGLLASGGRDEAGEPVATNALWSWSWS